MLLKIQLLLLVLVTHSVPQRPCERLAGSQKAEHATGRMSPGRQLVIQSRVHLGSQIQTPRIGIENVEQIEFVGHVHVCTLQDVQESGLLQPQPGMGCITLKPSCPKPWTPVGWEGWWHYALLMKARSQDKCDCTSGRAATACLSYLRP